jgi:hypothetical protein
MRRHDNVWRVVLVFLTAAGGVPAIGVGAVAVGAVVTTLLSGCNAEQVTRLEARRCADGCDAVIRVVQFFPGAGAVVVSVLGPLRDVCRQWANGQTPSAQSVGKLAAAAGAASPSQISAASDMLGASPTSSGSAGLIEYPKLSTKIASPSVYAEALMQAAKVTAKAAPARDLRPLLRDTAASEAQYVSRENTKRIGAGVAGFANFDSVKYLTAVASNPSTGPWNLDLVARILNEPGRNFSSRGPSLPDPRTGNSFSASGATKGSSGAGVIGLLVLGGVAYGLWAYFRKRR